MKKNSVVKKVNKSIDTVGKKLGMNYFERRKFRRTVSGFGYDVAVATVSGLVISGIETIAYGVGRVTGAAFNAVSDGVENIRYRITTKNVECEDEYEDDEEIDAIFEEDEFEDEEPEYEEGTGNDGDDE